VYCGSCIPGERCVCARCRTVYCATAAPFFDPIPRCRPTAPLPLANAAYFTCKSMTTGEAHAPTRPAKCIWVLNVVHTFSTPTCTPFRRFRGRRGWTVPDGHFEPPLCTVAPAYLVHAVSARVQMNRTTFEREANTLQTGCCS
jgi:hypothetical protein